MPGSAMQAEIGIIGGSGLYSLLPDAREVAVETPYGEPSDPLLISEIDGRSVAFLARHGRDHRFPPHRINYRANLWALRSVGVRQILAPCAVGSPRPDYGPGTIVVPDQLVDRTTGRVQTYYDRDAVHVSFADPYCPTGRGAVLKSAGGAAAAGLGESGVVDGGAMVVIEGPRFSTRAESQWYARQGWPVVNMTGHPEAVLARELALCYTAVCLVTDHDAGIEGHEAVSQAEVFRVFRENIERLRGLLLAVVRELPAERTCECAHSLDGLTLPIELP